MNGINPNGEQPTRASIRETQGENAFTTPAPIMLQPQTPEPPAPPNPQRNWKKAIVIAGSFLAVVAVTIVATVFLMSRFAKADLSVDDNESATYIVSGSIKVAGEPPSYDQFMSSHGDCRALDGYDDVEKGARVILRDDKDEIIGLGVLGKGTAGYIAPGKKLKTSGCEFSFSIRDVEIPEGFASIEVGNRTPHILRSSELLYPIRLTLGY